MADLISNVLTQAQRIAGVDPVGALAMCARLEDLARDRHDYCLFRGQLQLALADAEGAKFWVERAFALGGREAAAFLARGMLSRNGGEPDRARRSYRVAITLAPDAPSAYNNLASLDLTREPKRADGFVQRALRLAPDLPEALTNAAALAVARDDDDEGHRLLVRALKGDPRLVAALVNFGTVAQRRGEYARALDLFGRGLMLEPQNASALNGLGVTMLSLGDSGQAERWFTLAIGAAPDFTDALFNLGALRQGVGDVAGALALYERIGAGSAHPASLLNAGIAYAGEKRYPEALAALRKGAALSPDNAETRNQLAVTLMASDQPEAAARTLRAAVALAPGAADYHYNLGRIVHRGQDTALALACYLRALRLGLGPRSSALAYSCVGFGWMERGWPQEGVRIQKVAVALAPDVADVYSNIGLGYQNAGQHALALGSFRRALGCVPLDGSALVAIGLIHLSKGEAARAESRLRVGLAFDPADRLALFSLGSTELSHKADPKAAARFFARVTRVFPEYVLGWNNLGLALQYLGQLDEAMECYNRTIAENPAYAAGHYNLALAHARRGRLEEAESRYRQAIQYDPRLIAAHTNLAILLSQANRDQEAMACYRAAGDINPERPDLHGNLANLYQKQGFISKAIAGYRKAMTVDPAYGLAYYNLGCTLEEMKDHAASQFLFQRALNVNPDHRAARYNLGCALHATFAFDQAVPVYREVLRREPDNYRASANLASALQALGECQEALALYGQSQVLAAGQGAVAPAPDVFQGPQTARVDDAEGALEATEDKVPQELGLLRAADTGGTFPAALWNKALLQLSLGQLDEGWRGYETRFSQKVISGRTMRPFRQPLWNGERPLAAKRVVVWREQGIGDEIMFGSCIPDLIALGPRVTIECSVKLRPLFQRSFPQARVVLDDWRFDEKRDDLDFHVPMGSLPRFFRTRLESFPEQAGFLKPDPGRVLYWRSRLRALGPGPYVGVCWRGRLQTFSRGHHYTRIEDWEGVLSTPGVLFINMQYDEASAEIARARSEFGARIHTFTDIDMWNDLDDVAALLMALDMLLTAGTAVMSLAGGLGLPTWLLWVDNLENWPCLGTGGLPWYPRIRLFRRNLERPWREITDRLAEEFRAIVPELVEKDRQAEELGAEA